MPRRPFLVLASFFAFLIFAGLNIAAQSWLSTARLDFTENRLYTLSDGTREVAASLAEPVDLTFVFSRRLAAEYPVMRTYGARVRELLAEIAAKSGGDVRVREVDPSPFSAEEDDAIAAGLSSAPTSDGDPLYLGVIGRNSVDDEIIIPFLGPERETLLEYDLARLIAQLDDPQPPRVGVLSSLPGLQGRGMEADAYYVLREMARSFEIVPITDDFDRLPDDVDVLLLAHPPELSDAQLFQIDQFILRTGRAFFALDPASKASLATRGRLGQLRSDLAPLDESLGVRLAPEVLVDRDLALPVELIENGRRVVAPQPLFIASPPANVSDEDPITADLSRAVHFGLAGRLIAEPPFGAAVETLIASSPSAAPLEARAAAREPPPADVFADYVEYGAVQKLAVRLSGELRTAFPDGPPPADIPDDPVLAELALANAVDTPVLTVSATPAEIIFIADADFFDDGFYVNPTGDAPVADNAAFILNALDNLTGDAALAGLRSRAPSARPMARVETMRAEARERLYAEQASLEARLTETETALADLRARGAGSDFFAGDLSADLTDAERGEIARFRTEALDIRERLRLVEGEFRADIDKLAGRLALLNIWAPPFLVLVLWVVMLQIRARRRAQT